MKTRGYTLIELVIVIALLGIVVSIGSIILINAFKAAQTSSNFTEATWQSQRAFQRMVSEIREIQSTNNLSISPNNQITFKDPSNTTIQYQLSGTSLQRNGVSVADGVQSLQFTYYNQNYAATTTVTDVKCIEITTQIKKGTSNEESINNLRTVVCPRNLL